MIRHELKWSMLLSLIHTGLFCVYILLTKREVKMAWSIKDLLYGIRSSEKNDLCTCLFSSTEKETN